MRPSTDITGCNGVDDRASHDARTDVLSWVSVVAQVSGVAAAILFGSFYLALRHFYSLLGVSPSEVGWDFQGVLVHFIPVFLLVVFVVWAFRMRDRFKPVTPLSVPDDEKRSRWTVLAGSVLAAYVLVALIGMGFATVFANDAKGGHPLRGTIDRLFPVTAQCVTVAWLDNDAPAAETSGLSNGRPVLYLGRADGIAVFYDADADAPIRAPAARIVIAGC